jgi:hypothetical protein
MSHNRYGTLVAVSDEKNRERLAKLLRLASPSSGAPEPERIAAALAAAELFTKMEDAGKEQQREANQKKEAARRGHTAAPAPEPQNTNGVHYTSTPMRPRGAPFIESWMRSRSSVIYLRCVSFGCKRPIGINEVVWRRVNDGQVQWAHENCPRDGFTGI